MDVPLEDSTQDVKQLQRCINDLVGVLALPAIWRGTQPSQIAQTLLDVLLRMLSLEFAYARLSDASGSKPVEILRFAESSRIGLPAEEVRDMVRDFVTPQGSFRPSKTQFGVEGIAISPVTLGVQGDSA